MSPVKPRESGRRPPRLDGTFSILALVGVAMAAGAAGTRYLHVHLQDDDKPAPSLWLLIFVLLLATIWPAWRSWQSKQALLDRIAALEQRLADRDNYREGYATGYLEGLKAVGHTPERGDPRTGLRAVN